jgi:hypothetical protein
MITKINKEVTISARIFRADGTIEDHGVICSTDKKIQKQIKKKRCK